jgi:hypothetical protein
MMNHSQCDKSLLTSVKLFARSRLHLLHSFAFDLGGNLSIARRVR